MSDTTPPQSDSVSTRRDFLKKTAGLSAAGLVAGLPSARLFGGGSDVLKVGVIGCGGRGTGAAFNCVESSPNVHIAALGDMFPDRLANARKSLSRLGSKAPLTDDVCFTGFDAYKNVLKTDVDMVILATPPGFRPDHLQAAIAAGKHVFAEKPVAVDPAGIRKVLAAAEAADESNRCVVTGTQRRHQAPYLEIMKRIADGAIGEVVGGQCYWNQGGLWSVDRNEKMTDMEWQLRNWLYFTWLSGDHICEQHIHNIDVMNWAFGGPPVKAYGMGGRQSRTAHRFGHIFDHFAIEFEYENGARVQSFCRQIDGTDGRVGEHIVGTKGVSEPGYWISGPNAYRWKGKYRNPYVQEHADLISTIRSGGHINELKRVAESTLTAIMGRMSAYTGKTVRFDFALKSKLDLLPSRLEFGALPFPAVPMPGKDKLI